MKVFWFLSTVSPNILILPESYYTTIYRPCSAGSGFHTWSLSLPLPLSQVLSLYLSCIAIIRRYGSRGSINETSSFGRSWSRYVEGLYHMPIQHIHTRTNTHTHKCQDFIYRPVNTFSQLDIRDNNVNTKWCLLSHYYMAAVRAL